MSLLREAEHSPADKTQRQFKRSKNMDIQTIEHELYMRNLHSGVNDGKDEANVDNCFSSPTHHNVSEERLVKTSKIGFA